MGSPRVDQVDVVINDVDAAARFLAGLGVDLPAMAPGWAAHHRVVPSAPAAPEELGGVEPAFVVELDSTVFAQHWGGIAQSFVGLVLTLRVDERAAVDRLHEQATSIGGRSLKAPYDAFWGARCAVVEGPGPLVLAILSPSDPAHRSAPPDPATLG